MFQMKKALLLINPCAGKTKSKGGFFSLAQLLSDGDLLPTVYFTRAGGDATEQVIRRAPLYDLVICCGGDGTLNETVNGMLSLPEKDRRPIGYIPCGSTNDFAAALGIPLKIEKAAALITGGKTKRIDIGSFNGRFFNYVASFGAFTSVSYDTPQQVKNSIGRFAYILEGAKTLGAIRPYEVEYDCDGIEGKGIFLFGAASNTTSIGGIYKLPKKEVSLTDGRFELILLRDNLGSPETLWNIVHRKLTKDENIIFLHGKEIILRSDDAIPYTLDGEFGGKETVAKISCLANAVEIFC